MGALRRRRVTLLTPQRIVLQRARTSAAAVSEQRSAGFSRRGLRKLIHRWACGRARRRDLGADAPRCRSPITCTKSACACSASRPRRNGLRRPDAPKKIRSRACRFSSLSCDARAGTLRLKGLRSNRLRRRGTSRRRHELLPRARPRRVGNSQPRRAAVALAMARADSWRTRNKTGRTARAEAFVAAKCSAPRRRRRRARGRLAGLAAALDLHPDDARAAELRRLTEN